MRVDQCMKEIDVSKVINKENMLCNKLFTAVRSLKRHKNNQHLLIAESQDDTDNPLVAAHDIAFIIA